MFRSLNARLLFFSALSTALALLATAIILKLLFQGYFQARIEAELEVFLAQLTDHTSLSSTGEILVAPLSDPRFEEPLSGYYWQLNTQGQPTVLSPSSWSGPIRIDQPTTPGIIEFQTGDTTQGDRVLAASWIVTFDDAGQDRAVNALVAIDQSQIDASVSGFTSGLIAAMAILGGLLLIANWAQIQLGLRPLEQVRREVAAVADSRRERISSDHPQELLPLVGGMNDMLETQEQNLERARARAGDLAHGLKTPLTILQGVSHELGKMQRDDIADEVDTQIDTMRHFVERELAKARDETSGATWCDPAPVVDRLVNSLKHRVNAEAISWQVDIGQTALCPFDEYALVEVLGNLIDNAIKWTKDQVIIEIDGSRAAGFIRVLDNGPGIHDTNLSAARQRGVRLSEQADGHGLGLAIVEDMANQRGAVLNLRNRDKGGLAVEITW